MRRIKYRVPERKSSDSLQQRVTYVKNTIGDNWREVIIELAPDFEEACNKIGRHVPCPIHGGKDGFRLFQDADRTGGGICNSCGAFPDGFALLQWANNWSFIEALEAVAEYVGISSKNSNHRRKYNGNF